MSVRHALPLSLQRLTNHPCFVFRRHLTSVLDNAVVHKRGDGNYATATREYVLLPPKVTLDQAQLDQSVVLASLYAHKNIIFGARILNPTFEKDGMVNVCSPLLQAALDDASLVGEQPQAMSALKGLCKFVVDCLHSNDNILQKLDETSLQACKAIATGVPRLGHSVVGLGTFRDGQGGWDILAREYVDRNLCPEANLYKSFDGQVIAIEHLADKSPSYIREAGGAMCRIFFI